jgi:hypothetical protein
MCVSVTAFAPFELLQMRLTLPLTECKHGSAVVCLAVREDFYDAACGADY